MKLYLILFILLAVNLSACNAVPVSSATSTNEYQSVSTQTPMDNKSGNAVEPINTPDFSSIATPPAEMNPFIQLAEEDLTNRSGIVVDQIHFLKITEVDSLDIQQGCTTPAGQTTSKGRSSGYRIWLEANGTNYVYHVGFDNTVLFCSSEFQQ